MGSVWQWLTKSASVFTVVFYAFVSTFGLFYNWIFFHAFGINVLFFFELSDFVLSGLKLPALIAICAAVPLFNHFLILSWIPPYRHRDPITAKIFAVLSLLGFAVLMWLDISYIILPALLHFLFLTNPITAWIAPRIKEEGRRRNVAAGIAATGSIVTILTMTSVWAISDAKEYYDQVPRMRLVPKPDNTDAAANPVVLIGSTQKMAFFLDRSTCQVSSIPWTEITLLTTDTSESAIATSRYRACKIWETHDVWSEAIFNLWWPFGTRLLTKTAPGSI